MARCSAITKGGSRCRLDATHGSFCYQHSPQTEGERKRNARKGGRAGGNGRRSGTSELEQIKADIQGVIDGVADGSVGSGAVLFMGFNTLLRAVEVGRKIKDQDELERRISELETYAGTESKVTTWRA